MGEPVEGVRVRFAREAAREPGRINLARAALLIAAEEYPQLPVEHYLGRLDHLGEEVRGRSAGESAPLLVFEELRRVLVGRGRFRPGSEGLLDPRNSYLNDVLDRGTGIPLTLGIVLLEVGWRLGLPLEGVRFPGHFLVRFRGEGVRFLVDPCDPEAIHFEDEAGALLLRFCGPGVPMTRSYLRTADRREILLRLLSNLRETFTRSGDPARALAALDRILLLRAASPSDLRDRGLLLAGMGRGEEAGKALREYLDRSPAARDAGRIRRLLLRLDAEQRMEGGT